MPARRVFHRVALGLVSLGVLFLTWSQQTFLVRYQVGVGQTLVVILLAAGILLWPRSRWLSAMAVVTAGLEIAGLAADWRWALTTATLAAMVVASAGLVQASGRRPGAERSRPARVLIWGAKGIGAALAVVISVAVGLYAITPVPFAIAIRNSLGYGNSYDAPGPSTREVVSNGSLRISNVQYGTRYANSYLDIYIADNDASVKRPTYVYVHGGGWLAGSKEKGDPAAGSTDGVTTIGTPMLKAGYNVVFIDYALIPQATSPDGARQLGQAVQFLQSHGGQYGLDTSSVVLAGASGGANIVGQFAIAQTSTGYARTTGIGRVMAGNLKAVVLDSAALDTTRVAKTQTANLVSDLLFSLAERAYFRDSAKKLDQGNVLKHVTAGFPATFLSDGNTATFPDQSQDLHDRLDALGVTNSLDLYSRDEAELGHGFMVQRSRWTDDYNRKKVAFLARVLKH